MAKGRIPHVGRPFTNEVTANQLNTAFQTTGNVQAMRTDWPLLIEQTPEGGIRLWIDPAFLRRAVGPPRDPVWPVVVRDVRDDDDTFVMVQDVERNDSDPWDGIMAPVGKAYRISIWAHGKARDFRALVTREETLTRATPIVSGIQAIGQPWVAQYLRFDLLEPRDRLAFSDCVTAIAGGR